MKNIYKHSFSRKKVQILVTFILHTGNSNMPNLTLISGACQLTLNAALVGIFNATTVGFLNPKEVFFEVLIQILKE